MEKNQLSNQFACRLRDAMIAQGFNSQRSTSGVCIHKLAELTGYSLQICRKYLRGEAMPEPVKLMALAAQLQVSPGWLLFGDEGSAPNLTQESVIVSKTVLHTLFVKAAYLYRSHLPEQEVPGFLMGLIKDIMLINANDEQSMRIIDMAFSSLKYFSQSASA